MSIAVRNSSAFRDFPTPVRFTARPRGSFYVDLRFLRFLLWGLGFLVGSLGLVCEALGLRVNIRGFSECEYNAAGGFIFGIPAAFCRRRSFGVHSIRKKANFRYSEETQKFRRAGMGGLKSRAFGDMKPRTHQKPNR